MKRYSILIIISSFFFGCQENNDLVLQGNFEFIKDYSTSITVGGFVGITERTFQVGEVYTGTNRGGQVVTLRIANHSELNDECPNSWCYQEFLDVPREFLKATD